MTTLLDRIWASHAVATNGAGETLLFVDRHYCHEGSFHAFAQLDAKGHRVAHPELTFAFADHYVPSKGPVADAETGGIIERLTANAARHGIRLFGRDDPAQGIVHVAAPELGLTLPGTVVVCGDSHTSTHGAFGAFAFGIGASEVAHVLATQTLWRQRPRTMRVTFTGRLAPGVSAKDMILALIARIGVNGAAGHVIEYAGPAIRALGMEARMTVCNMSIEGGARAGLIAPDDTTVEWLAGREHAPKGPALDAAVAAWRGLASDADAAFDREVAIDASALAPMVSWGTSPGDTLPVTARVPEPEGAERERLAPVLDYMGLAPGTALEEIAVDRVFIGSCTNARLSDLREAAAVLRGRKAVVPGFVSPGSSAVRRAAEAEGLDRVFTEAGLEWRASGCSLCVGLNGDRVGRGERCASTTNRNFPGRQGQGARTHLMSPAMVAAAAVTGRITDVRRLIGGAQ